MRVKSRLIVRAKSTLTACVKLTLIMRVKSTLTVRVKLTLILLRDVGCRRPRHLMDRVRSTSHTFNTTPTHHRAPHMRHTDFKLTLIVRGKLTLILLLAADAADMDHVR